MCVAITPLLFRLFGPVISILLYPILLFAGGILFLKQVSIYWIAYFVTIAMSFNYTLYNVGKEIFYLPTDKLVKYKMKGLCDTFLFRLGDTLGSFAIFVFSSAIIVNYTLFGIIGLWFFIILKTGKKYNEFKKNQEILVIK
jgi:ATP/ADP translocase